MIEWTRAERNGSCGGCDKKITLGEPIQLTSIFGVRRRFIRCQECAGTAPSDLPALIPRHGNIIQPMNPIVPRTVRTPQAEWTPYRDT